MPPPRGLVQQFDQHLHKSRLLAPGQRLLVACSGGADSVALLRLLHAVNQSDTWNFKLVVAHVDHQLRGKESTKDASFVRALARTLKLPYITRKVTIPRTGAGVASEAAARTARFKALLQMKSTKKCHTILLAHHANDQAETILLRILRGCGIAGLAGISPQSTYRRALLTRPLLAFTREDLRAYLMDIKQPWREDASNQTPAYLRNRIRNEIMPALMAIQPKLPRTLSRLGTNARLAGMALAQHTERVLEQATIRSTRTSMELHFSILCRAMIEFRRGALREALIHCGAPSDRIDFDRLLQVAREIRTPFHGPRQYDFAGNLAIHFNSTTITVKRTKRRPR